MASITNTTYVDDIDGKPADDTVAFALDGADYEIDLSKKNASSLRKSLADFVAAARPVTRFAVTAPERKRSSKRSQETAAQDSADREQIREWALANDIAVGQRGRITAAVREQFAAAQAQDPTS